MITEMDFARVRAHRSNIARYQRLLETKLTALERTFLERRLSEEHAQLRSLAESRSGNRTPQPSLVA